LGATGKARCALCSALIERKRNSIERAVKRQSHRARIIRHRDVASAVMQGHTYIYHTTDKALLIGTQAAMHQASTDIRCSSNQAPQLLQPLKTEQEPPEAG